MGTGRARKSKVGFTRAKRLSELQNAFAEAMAQQARSTSNGNNFDGEVKRLKALWAVHFPKIDFQPQPLRWYSEQQFNARVEIERALRILADAHDPVRLSRSRMHDTGEHHSRFTIPDGIECRLFYRVKDGRIEVSRMCQRKDC